MLEGHEGHDECKDQDWSHVHELQTVLNVVLSMEGTSHQHHYTPLHNDRYSTTENSSVDYASEAKLMEMACAQSCRNVSEKVYRICLITPKCPLINSVPHLIYALSRSFGVPLGLCNPLEHIPFEHATPHCVKSTVFTRHT